MTEEYLQKKQHGEEIVAENKMSSMPINKLLFSMSLPTIIALLVQALYNIVDSYFVAQIGNGQDALTAVGLAFPIQLVMISGSVGLSIGVSALISRKLGEKDEKGAALVGEHGFLLGIMLYVIFFILGILLSKFFIGLFTDNSTVIAYGSDYLKIIMIFSFGMIFAQACIGILQGTGNMVSSMVTQLIGAVTNIILNPILIFGLFGFPAMEVKGAALATIIGQIISMIYALIIVLKGKQHLQLNIKNFKYCKATIIDILKIGLPAAIMQGLSSVMLVGLNFILAAFSEAAVAVFNVYFKIQSIIIMPVIGLGQGVMPIVGFNYGAKNKKRITQTVKLGSVAAVIFMTLGTVLFQVFPEQMLMVFNANEEMLEIGVYTLRIISLGFPLAAVSIVLSTFFQGLGDSYISMIVSFIRQIIVLLPCSYILGYLFGINGVWFGFFVGEIVAIIVSLAYYKKLKKTKLNF